MVRWQDMPAKKYVVVLDEEARQSLERAACSNKRSLRERQRTRILLASANGQDDAGIAQAMGVHLNTVAGASSPQASRASVARNRSGANLTVLRRLAERLEIHHTPKHGSWLNMAEIELSVLARQCLDERMENQQRLTTAVAAWEQTRNAAAVRIDWRFTTADARIKLKRLYPQPLP